MLEVNKQKS